MKSRHLPLRLFLLRHAKSSREDASLADADRPLAERGEDAALAMGREMARLGYVPDLVLCSPAVRARETWQRVARSLPPVAETRIVQDLYDFGDGSRLLEAVIAHGGAAQRLLLVGHNPSIEGLARSLAQEGDGELLERLARKYPTGALAVLALPIARWSELGQAGGRLTAFIRPADLAE
jgi:phosphohistidine phosphatase